MASNNKIYLSITAVDTLFFKDSRPFTAGDESWARSMFPPSMTVLHGMIRQLWLKINRPGWEADREKVIALLKEETPNDFQKIKITDVLLSSDDTLKLYPIPYDLAFNKKDKEFYLPKRIAKLENPSSLNASLQTGIYKMGQLEIQEDSLLEQEELEEYLSGEWQETISNYRIAGFISEEKKIGIEKSNATGASAFGKIYSTQFVQLDNWEEQKTRIIIEVDGFDMPKDSYIIRMGGEGKYVKVAKLDNFQTLRISPKTEETENKFKIYFQSPIAIKQQSLPHFINKNFMGDFKHWGLDIGFKVDAVFTGRIIGYGGWDLALNKPKPYRKFLPQGTVIYATKTQGENTLNELFQTLDGKSLAKGDDAFKGFGIIKFAR